MNSKDDNLKKKSTYIALEQIYYDLSLKNQIFPPELIPKYQKKLQQKN